jgi:hypothetical protein
MVGSFNIIEWDILLFKHVAEHIFNVIEQSSRRCKTFPNLIETLEEPRFVANLSSKLLNGPTVAIKRFANAIELV